MVSKKTTIEPRLLVKTEETKTEIFVAETKSE
jgi:hypothetical protein